MSVGQSMTVVYVCVHTVYSCMSTNMAECTGPGGKKQLLLFGLSRRRGKKLSYVVGLQ